VKLDAKAEILHNEKEGDYFYKSRIPVYAIISIPDNIYH